MPAGPGFYYSPFELGKKILPRWIIAQEVLPLR
jgi:hypothetical protein